MPFLQTLILLASIEKAHPHCKINIQHGMNVEIKLHGYD